MNPLKPSVRLTESQSQLTYRVIRSSRKTLAVYVYPSGEVLVRSPRHCSDADIHRYMREREQWVVKSLSSFLNVPRPLTLTYELGEEHAYLGELYPLALIGGEKRLTQVVDGGFQVSLRPGDGAPHIKATLIAWYRHEALSIFAKRLDFCFRAFSEASVRKPPLKIRRMKARWGSCSSLGEVTLNLELIKHPVHVIDYVITHELCHLIEFNHSPRFYELMAQAIPTWKKSKEDLEKGVFLYGSF